MSDKTDASPKRNRYEQSDTRGGAEHLRAQETSIENQVGAQSMQKLKETPVSAMKEFPSAHDLIGAGASGTNEKTDSLRSSASPAEARNFFQHSSLAKLI